MDALFQNALLFGGLLSLALAAVMLTSFAIAPDMWVGDYPPDVRAAYGEMSERAKKVRPFVAVFFFGIILLILLFSMLRLQRLAAAEPWFWEYALSNFIVLMTFNLFDLLIADWLIFVSILPQRAVLPGTEGMAGYKDYGFHFRGFLSGIGFCAVGALVFALPGWLLI